MKVVSFHSFKGGRGRTTAIACLANLCARLGKHVVLLDADVTAPWLHTRYNIPDSDIQERPWLGGLLNELAMSPASVSPSAGLSKYWLRVDPPSTAGSVHLIPPGDPHATDYWRWVAEEFPRFLGLRRNPHILESWRDLRLMIATTVVEPDSKAEPDLLFVDAPAGNHEASAFVAIGLADTAVVFGSADYADAKWTSKLIEMIESQRTQYLDEVYGSLRTVAIRARYPDYFHTSHKAAIEFDEFVTRLSAMNFDAYGSLDSDPRLELGREGLPIPLVGPVYETPLIKHYCELLTKTLPGEWPEGANPLGGLPPDEVRSGSSMSLFLLYQDGMLTNPADSERNVALRVETLCGLLDHLHNELMPSSAVDSESLTDTSDTLRRAGKEQGVTFGEKLWDEPDYKGPYVDRVQKWCEFDSRVGFGHLMLKRPLVGRDQVLTGGDKTLPEGKETLAGGEVEVEDNFLAMLRTEEDPDLCPFLSGYIEGVLQKLLEDDRVKVEHPRESCMRVHSDRTACNFEFTVEL